MPQDGYKTSIWTQSAFSFVTERGQVGNYMQSVSHNTAINCDKLAKIAHLLPFEYTEIHMNYLHSESSQNLAEKQKH